MISNDNKKKTKIKNKENLAKFGNYAKFCNGALDSPKTKLKMIKILDHIRMLEPNQHEQLVHADLVKVH